MKYDLSKGASMHVEQALMAFAFHIKEVYSFDPVLRDRLLKRNERIKNDLVAQFRKQIEESKK